MAFQVVTEVPYSKNEIIHPTLCPFSVMSMQQQWNQHTTLSLQCYVHTTMESYNPPTEEICPHNNNVNIVHLILSLQSYVHTKTMESSNNPVTAELCPHKNNGIIKQSCHCRVMSTEQQWNHQTILSLQSYVYTTAMESLLILSLQSCFNTVHTTMESLNNPVTAVMSAQKQWNHWTILWLQSYVCTIMEASYN